MLCFVQNADQVSLQGLDGLLVPQEPKFDVSITHIESTTLDELQYFKVTHGGWKIKINESEWRRLYRCVPLITLPISQPSATAEHGTLSFATAGMRCHRSARTLGSCASRAD